MNCADCDRPLGPGKEDAFAYDDRWYCKSCLRVRAPDWLTLINRLSK